MGTNVILRLNTVTKTWYDESGALFSDEMPQIPYKSAARVEVHLYTETPNAGSEGVVPDTDWTKDTQYAVPGITARLSADNNFLRHTKGTLAEAVPAGTVSAVSLNLPGISSVGELDPSGTIRLFAADGSSEALSYTAREKTADHVYSFTIEAGSSVENSYAQNADADSTESLYMTAAMSVDESDPANGVFSFDITAYSQKLREAADYANSLRVDDVQGLELAIGLVEDDTTSLLNSYICRSFSIPLPMAEINSTPAIPDTAEDNIAAITTSLLAGGFSVQFSTDGTTWHDAPQTTADTYYRFRLASTPSAPWAVVLMTRGDDGDPGTSAYVYVAYASDASGTGFSLTPSDSLKYRAEIHTDEEIQSPSASDFSGATWVKYIGDQGQQGDPGDDGVSAYTYVAYASDALGTDFSLTPSNLLQYRAEIHVDTAIATPSASDFANATWVKYIGDPGSSSYTYVGYATDASGTDFSLTPTNTLKYRAEIHTNAPIATPSYTDFANATWVKYIGDNGQAGTGTGDMLISVYDTNSDGKVNAADSADAAVKLSNARYIGSAAFDGTANITLAQMGAASTADLAGKMANPSNSGTTGNVLTKTASGYEWAAPSGGGSGEENVIEAITFNGSAVPVADKTAAITASIPSVDATPTSGSANAAQSGGVYTALQGKADASHTHTPSDISGLAAALSGKLDKTASITSIEVVSALPASPSATTLYIIPEA